MQFISQSASVDGQLALPDDRSIPEPRPSTGAEGGGLLHFVEALFRNKVLVVGIAVTVMLTCIAYAVLAKPAYESDTLIVVQNSRAMSMVSAESGSPTSGVLTTDGIEEQLNSKVALLGTQDLLEGLVSYRDQLKGMRPPGSGSLEMTRQLQAMRQSLEITPVRKTNLIGVTFTDVDPMMAQKSLRWICERFLSKQAELSRPPGTYQFFDAQAKQYEEQLREAQAALITFDSSKQVTSLEQEKTLDLKNFSDSTKEVDEVQATLRADKARMATLQVQEETVAPRLKTQVRSGANQGSTERLDSVLAELQNRRIELLNRFQPSDVTVQELDAELASTKAAMSRIEARQAAETTEDVNPVRTQVEVSAQKTSGDIGADEARLATLTAGAKSYGARLSELQAISIEHDLLDRKVQELKQNRDKFSEKRDDARIEDELDRSKIVDVAIAEEPTFSWQPVRPHRRNAILLGGVLSSFLSLGLVFLKEIGRETIVRPAELDVIASCPVLATIPELRVLGSSRGFRSPTLITTLGAHADRTNTGAV